MHYVQFVADFGNLKQGFLSMKLIQKSNFRVCFFNNWIEKNQNNSHSDEGFSSHTSLRDGSHYQIGWIFGKVLICNWPPPPTPQKGPHIWKSCARISYFILPKCWSQNLTPLSLHQRYSFFICGPKAKLWHKSPCRRQEWQRSLTRFWFFPFVLFSLFFLYSCPCFWCI